MRVQAIAVAEVCGASWRPEAHEWIYSFWFLVKADHQQLLCLPEVLWGLFLGILSLHVRRFGIK